MCEYVLVRLVDKLALFLIPRLSFFNLPTSLSVGWVLLLSALSMSRSQSSLCTSCCLTLSWSVVTSPPPSQPLLVSLVVRRSETLFGCRGRQERLKHRLLFAWLTS